MPVRPQRVRKRPATFRSARARLPLGILEARGLVDDQHVEERVIVGKAGELADQPGHQVDADHRHLALGRGGEERPPALGAAVENGDAKMPKVRPGRDLGRPYGRGDELRRDDEGVPAVPVADQLGDRRERGGALAGAERRDQKGGVVFVQIGRGALLVRAQDAGRGVRSLGGLRGLIEIAAAKAATEFMCDIA